MTRIRDVQLIIPAASLSNGDIAASADIATTKMAQRVLSEHPVPPSAFRVWDNAASLPVTTAASDDLALIMGTPGTDFPRLRTSDAKATTVTQKIGFFLPIPANYDDGQTVQIRVRGNMITTVSDGTATVDLEAYASDLDGAVGSDLVSTSATTINSLTEANVDFAVDGGNVDPGSLLACVLTIAITDAATGTAVIGQVSDVRLMLDTRG